MKGKTGKSLGRLTVAFWMSCRAGWSVTTEGAAGTWVTDDQAEQSVHECEMTRTTVYVWIVCWLFPFCFTLSWMGIKQSDSGIYKPEFSFKLLK